MLTVHVFLHLQGALSQLRQLELFKEYKSKLEAAIGKEKTKDLVKKAAYFVSAGTNDFAFNYYGPTLVQRTTYPNESDYQQFMWQHIEQFLQVYHKIFLIIVIGF